MGSILRSSKTVDESPPVHSRIGDIRNMPDQGDRQHRVPQLDSRIQQGQQERSEETDPRSQGHDESCTIRDPSSSRMRSLWLNEGRWNSVCCRSHGLSLTAPEGTDQHPDFRPRPARRRRQRQAAPAQASAWLQSARLPTPHHGLASLRPTASVPPPSARCRSRGGHHRTGPW